MARWQLRAWWDARESWEVFGFDYLPAVKHQEDHILFGDTTGHRVALHTHKLLFWELEEVKELADE